MKKLVYLFYAGLILLIFLIITKGDSFQCSNSKDYNKIKACALNVRFAPETKENIKNFDYVINSQMQTDKDFSFLYRRAMVGCRLDNECSIKSYISNYIKHLEICSKEDAECLRQLKFIKENNDIIYYKEVI